ncbi:flagellar motor protein MotB [Bacillus sp. FJAT-27251]|uniref:flagellar motor protein MotB n=1 Tax=Bacillus sp. FJAT-27251 TaxID=1684142 RepID=UPI0006A7D4D0|nr:flagellar motor protein MotB [Bacillus sp. FJAT-27251]
MKRTKKHEEHVDESWLIPYADILTLLLALFIVLFAASEVDSKKFEAIAKSFNSAMEGGTGVLDYNSPVEPIDETGQIPKQGEASTEQKPEHEESEMTPEQDFKELGELQQSIEGYIEEKGLSPRLQTELTAQGLLVTITDEVLFRSGDGDVTNEARKLAVEMSHLLVSDPPRQIVIEGHTDNQPIRTAKYPSNWELSSARAINFMKILIENPKLDPRKFSATGYGEYQPVDTNDTLEGRAKNRRVEVLILPYQQQNE